MRNVIECFKLQKYENTKGKKMKLKPKNSDGTNFELVGDFMEAFGQTVQLDPTWPDFNTRELRLELIQEELDELAQAVDDRDMIAVSYTHLTLPTTPYV